MVRSVLCAVFLVLLTLVPAAAQPDIAGTYRGTIINNQTEIPVDTVLREKGGRISGSYVLHDPTDGDVTGSISEVAVTAAGVATLTWTDMYGSGSATLTFTPDGGSFSGKWYAGGQVGGFWNGARVP
jgi:hypothetical protein